MPHVLTITKQIQAIIAPRDDNNAMTFGRSIYYRHHQLK